jgi:hypothetical protein
MFSGTCNDGKIEMPEVLAMGACLRKTKRLRVVFPMNAAVVSSLAGMVK